MYKIRDLQFECKYFADGTLFENKKEIIDHLASYHDTDFSGVDNEDNELNIWDYFKYWGINTIKEKLNWLLEYGEWKIENA